MVDVGDSESAVEGLLRRMLSFRGGDILDIKEAADFMVLYVDI